MRGVAWLLNHDDVGWVLSIRFNLGSHPSAGPEIVDWFSFEREVYRDAGGGERGWKEAENVEKKQGKRFHVKEGKFLGFS